MGSIGLSTSTEAWNTLAAKLVPSSKDAAFWWQMTGPTLAILLLEAGYDLDSQRECLLFHYNHIVSRLGARPTSEGLPDGWNSFVTDDYSPVEYSWSWDSEQASPKVRYTLEAIGPDAGSTNDPFNQAMAVDLIRELGVNEEWFSHFSKAFVHSGDEASVTQQILKSPSDQSSVLVAFDLQKGGVAAKAYLIPVKAEQTGRSRLSVVTDAVRSLERPDLKFPAYNELRNFMSTDPSGSQLEIVSLAVDCVDPSKSRLRIYVRSSSTSWDHVCAILSMSGRLSNLDAGNTRSNLRELWRLVLSLDKHFSPSEDLPETEHQTGGVLYNFDIKPNNARPEAKLYIPAKHYAKNDLAAAEGLTTYLEGQGRARFVANYMRALEGVCTHRALESGRGLQTYIGCGLERESLSLTSYIAPEMYHPARWAA
ncbi:MAG: hypothetical protein LQ347_006426 [Umbilicaria vellea]|nr:MAG: hypothetical protein LQ347_006426 [Umbilicaria vellea]